MQTYGKRSKPLWRTIALSNLTDKTRLYHAVMDIHPITHLPTAIHTIHPQASDCKGMVCNKPGMVKHIKD